MKISSLTLSALTLAAFFLAVPAARALTPIGYTWDTGAAGSPSYGSGTWDASTTANWTTDGGTTKATWGGATGNAIFAGADGTYTITVAGPLTGNAITFQNSGYTLSAGSAQTISLVRDSGSPITDPIISVASGKSADIGNNVTISPTTTGIEFTGAGTLNIDTGATITESSSGNLLIDNFGTVVVNGGTLSGTNVGSQIHIGGTNGGSLTLASGTISSTSTSSGNVFVLTTGGVFHLNGGTLSVGQVEMTGGTGFIFNGGTLKVANNSFLSTFMYGGVSATISTGGAIIDTNGFNASTTTATGGHGGDFQHDAALAGAADGGLTKNGLGTFTLVQATTYNGTTTVNQGTLQATNGKALGFGGPQGLGVAVGKANVAASATLDLSGAITVDKPITLTGASLINSSSGTTAILDNGVAGVQYSGAGSGYAGTISVVYSGGGGSGATTTAVQTSGAISKVTTTATGSGYTSAPTVTINGSGGGSGTATATAILSSLALSGSSNTIGGAGNLTINAVVSDSGGAGGFSKTDAGTLTLTGANTYTGLLTLTGGTLNAATAGINGSSTTNGISFNGGTLQAASGGITTAKAIAMTGAGTFDTNGNNSTLSGAITGSGGALTKAGAGTLTLSGTSNTYSLGTTVSGGTLLVTNASGSATGSGALSVARGAALAGTGTSSGSSFAIGGTSGSGTASVYVGQTAATGDTNTTNNLTLKGSGASTIANANLTFNLNTTAGGGNELLVGSTAITFGSGGVGANPVTLTLNLQGGGTGGSVPYFVLIAGTAGNGSLASTQYSGLSFGTQFAADGGFLTPITNSTVGGSGNLILALNLNGSPNFYGGQAGLYLYQTAGGVDDIVVIPEPGTWALMLGGLAVLIFWQHRKNRV